MRVRQYFIVLSLSLICPAGAHALSDRIDTTLSIRSDLWSGSRQLDDAGAIAQVSAWGKAKLDLGDAGTVVGDAWMREQSRDDPDTPLTRLRELYWRAGTGAIEWKIGRQMITWGRADGINPTDNLSPRDFTLLAPEDGDLRYGNEVAQVSVSTELGNFSGLYFPQAASHTIPLTPLPNVGYSVERPPRQSQWALKWDFNGDISGSGFDGSVSYFDGIHPMPDLNFGGITANGVDIAVRNHTARIFGADISLVHDNIVWRAEGAWMQTDSTGGNDFIHKKPQVSLVAGAEWTFDNNTTLGLQGLWQRVKNYQSPDQITNPIEREIAWRQAATSNQTATHQTGLTWRLAGRWKHDTLLAETSGVIVWSSGGHGRDSGVWRTKLDYAIDDHWKLQTGTEYYFGSEHSFFGQLRKNRLLYVQVRYGW